MLPENTQENTDNNVEFLFERPIGWSSACLDSTINYYLHCNNQDTHLENDAETKQYKS